MAADHHNDDLDELLDSALDDFHNLNLNNVQRRGGGGEEEEGRTRSGVQGLGLGLGLPDLKSKKKKGKQKEKAPKKEKEKEKEKESHVSEALDQLRAQTREAVKGLESVTATSNPNADDAIMEDWVKQFEALAGSQGMESIMETMMQQLLSKEILHEPMKEIGERYPKWLAEHASSLSKEEYERFSHQYKLIKDLNEVYEKEPSNFHKIVELMQKMQECGQPPSDILHELAPDFDLASLGQISPEMLESQENCCIM